MLPVNGNLLPTVSKFFDDDWNNMLDWSNRNVTHSPATLPSVNIHEDADHFIVEMAAPGLSKKDFNISLDNDSLSISAELKSEDDSKKGSFTRREFSYQSFRRTFSLNKRVVDDAKIAASYADGILKIVLPKKDEAKDKPARTIKIS